MEIASTMPAVRIASRAARSLRHGHPWVFSNDVREATGSPAPGDVVRVVQGEAASPRDLGTAFFNPHSLIALRHLSWEGAIPDRDLIRERLMAAARLRERLHPDSDAHRLCHGEADFLPGLFIDSYAGVHVVQALAAGMDRLLGDVVRVLVDDLGARAVIERDESHLRDLEGLPQRTGLLAGTDPGRLVIATPPARLVVDPLSGQKTGSYLDQRENRIAAARHARGVAVYDGHANAGGFAIHAALADATSVTAVDASAPALDLAREAARLNGVEGRIAFVVADVMEDMEARHRRRERFGLVILDPPSFTQSRKHVPQARRAMRALNRRAMTLVEAGGVLVSSCCSHHVREEAFLETLRHAALDASRTLRWLEIRSQPPDHPVLAAMPETRYLACAIAQVL